MSAEERVTGKKMRVAVFGAGKMAFHHIKAISLQENADLVAIADPNIDTIRHSNEFPPGVSLFSSAEDLLSKMKPDIVHICSPPDTHSALAELALREGANLYVEKPFAMSIRDATNIIALAEESGLRICAGHQLLFEEPSQKAKVLMGKLGRIVHVESYFSFKPVRRSRDGRTAISPLDQLVDILPHPVYLLLHFMKFFSRQNGGDPVQLRAIDVNPTGDVHGNLHYRNVAGNLVVTLEGRPIESYIKVIGTNGSLHADFVRGTVVVLAGPGTSGISKVINPYSQSWQTISQTTRSLWKRAFKKQKSYPGLAEIIRSFYKNLTSDEPMEISNEAILETVSVCEKITEKLKDAEAEENARAEAKLNHLETQLPLLDRTRGGVLITGGTGMLGKAVAAELRKQNWPTRVLARAIPHASKRVPGVEYIRGDLGEEISLDAVKDISIVVHCAAETVGGKEAHTRNSIEATRNILTAMANAGVRKLIHISSIAVLKSSRETGAPVDENTPIIDNSEEKGPYVWGKVESERLARTKCKELGVEIRVIRPGPLVDYEAFEAPGRLGREIGPYFICVGRRRDRFSLCDVFLAAKVIQAYVEKFEDMPSTLNLIEPDAPSRADLISRLLHRRPDLKVYYIPFVFFRTLSPLMKLLQRLIWPRKKPLDIGAIFSPENYKYDLAAYIVHHAAQSLNNKTSYVKTKTLPTTYIS